MSKMKEEERIKNGCYFSDLKTKPSAFRIWKSLTYEKDTISM